MIAKVIEINDYHYQLVANELHFEQVILISNDPDHQQSDNCLAYFQQHTPCFDLLAGEDGTLILYKNSDLLTRLSAPKSFIVSAVFDKSSLFTHHFDSQMQFNQWCFDNYLTHKLLKKQVQIYSYYDAIIQHPILGTLCLPPIVWAKHHPDLNLSSSIAELAELEPILIPVKKGQGIHFDKYHYQCRYAPIFHFLRRIDAS